MRVIEHAGDYAQAVAAGRAQALAAPRSHFVDDEQSELLFFGYAAAAHGLARQLAEAGRKVDAEHPLFVYIPCGVGGAPGGITHGLKALYGDHAHCFFAEPVASPCMLVQLAAGMQTPTSVYDLGLDNRTEADGLAVGQASELVASLMTPQLGGVFTVSDDELYLNLLALKDSLTPRSNLGRRRRLGAGLAAGLGRRPRLCPGPGHGQRHARHLGHWRIAGAA